MKMKAHKTECLRRGGCGLLSGLLVFLLCACAARQQTAGLPATAAPTATLTPEAAASPAPTATPTPKLATPAPSVAKPTEAAEKAAPTPAKSYTFAGQAVCTAGSFVNIRFKAGTDGRVVGKLPAGKTVSVIQYQSGWAFVSYNGTVGYVSRDYLISRRSPKVSVPMGDWARILVNPSHRLPEGFKASVASFAGGQVDARILGICKAMFADAKKDGVTFKLVDAYRSHALQGRLYEEKVQSYIAKGYSRADAEKEAATITARPGTSEHETGLALDIVTPSYTARDKGFANTKAFKWLEMNAHNYGFTLRYKKDKVSLTGVIYEPWHWRFVGVEAATAMKQSGQCLEEYFG